MMLRIMKSSVRKGIKATKMKEKLENVAEDNEIKRQKGNISNKNKQKTRKCC